jgi:poly-beta-hydroxybutyrate-responsive repressor
MNDDGRSAGPSGDASGVTLILDFDRCVCSGKTLVRLLRPAILAVLSRAPTHGYVLVQRLAELDLFSSGSPDPSGVYRTLRDMEQEGLVTSTWETGNGGPAKRRYELADGGAACLLRWADTLQRYRTQIDGLLGLLTRKGTLLPMASGPSCACRSEETCDC